MMAAKRSKETKKALSYLPHNINAEKAVLGSALISKDALFNVLSSLDENDFYLGKHQIIYRALYNLMEKKIAVDVLTVTEELINLKELDNIGGVPYLQECSDSMVALSNLEFYINIVVQSRILIVSLKEFSAKSFSLWQFDICSSQIQKLNRLFILRKISSSTHQIWINRSQTIFSSNQLCTIIRNVQNLDI